IYTASTLIYTLSLHDALPIFYKLLFTQFNRFANVSSEFIGDVTLVFDLLNTWTRVLAGDALFLSYVFTKLTLFSQFSFHYYLLRSEEHTSELQSRENLVCRLL